MNSDGENAGAAFVGIVAGIILVILMGSCAPDTSNEQCYLSNQDRRGYE